MTWSKRRRRHCRRRHSWSKATAVGKAGCVSGAVTRRVPLDWMLHTVQGVQAGHLRTIYGPQMCCIWPTRVKQWAGLAIASTIPPTPRSLYSLILLHWPLQTVLFVTPVFEEQSEKAGKTGWGQVCDGRHTSSEIGKS